MLTPSLGPDLLNFNVWPPESRAFFFFFLVKSKIVNILGFLAHMVSVTPSQLCLSSGKVAIDNI